MLNEQECQTILMNPQTAQGDDWLLERKDYIGASEIGTLLGVNRWETPASLWMKKKGLLAPKALTESMVHGLNHEAYVQWCFEALVGLKTERSHTYRTGPGLILGATPDFEVYDPNDPGFFGLLEVKTAGTGTMAEFSEASGGLPERYAAQCQFQMGVAGATVCYLWALVCGQRLERYTVQRDEEVIANLFALATGWWETYMVGDETPPMTASTVDKELLDQMYPVDNNLKVYATPDQTELIAGLWHNQKHRKEYEAEEKRIVNQLKAEMGECSILESQLGTATWKADKNGQRSFRMKWEGESNG